MGESSLLVSLLLSQHSKSQSSCAKSRNSTRQHEGIPSSRRILRFHSSLESCHFWKSLPTMCVRSLGASQWKPIGARIQVQRARRVNQKEKGTQSWCPISR